MTALPTIFQRFQPATQSTFASSAILLFRLVIGIAFILHGLGKIQTPFGWMPPGGPVAIPPIFQFLAAFSEFGGGIALVLGLLTPLAALGIAFTMVVAVYMHAIVFHDPFVNPTGGSSFEPALGYLASTIVLLATGPGKFSLDAFIFKRKA
jgi:putative oxidoreductase